MPRCCSISIGRCASAGASRRPRRAPTRRGRSAASCTSTSGRRRSPSGAISAAQPTDYIVATYREHAHYLARTRRRARRDGGALRQGDRLRRRPRRLDAPLRRQPTASSAAGRSSAATCRSPPAWRSRPSIATSTTSRSASSVTARPTWAPSTRASRSRRCGSCPIVFICENNQYAMGTPLYRTLAVEDVAVRARGLPDRGRHRERRRRARDARAPSRHAVERARKTKSLPFFLEAKTYRFRGHSMSDPAKYRTQGRGRGVDGARSHRDPGGSACRRSASRARSSS